GPGRVRAASRRPGGPPGTPTHGASAVSRTDPAASSAERTRSAMRIIDAHQVKGYNAHMKGKPSMRRRDRTAAKRATNVSIRSDLLNAARDAGVNLSATLERALAEELARRRRARWREENREAITAYNEYVDAHGTLRWSSTLLVAQFFRLPGFTRKPVSH